VPPHDALRLGEQFAQGVALTEVRPDVVEDFVVETEQGEMQLRNDEVLVVAGIAGEGDILAVAR
jgi:hypothetical protein